MIELAGILVLLGGLFALLLFVAAPIVLALFLISTVLRIVFFALFLPLRILGWGIGIGLSAIGLLGMILTGLVGVAFLVGIAPLVPLLIFAGIIYLLVRSSRRRQARAVNA